MGATTDPVWRWDGGPTSRGDEDMEGRQAKWQQLHAIHLCEGRQAAVFETALIKWAKRRFPRECANAASDSRGLVKALPNFLYIATKQIEETSRQPVETVRSHKDRLSTRNRPFRVRLGPADQAVRQLLAAGRQRQAAR